MNHLVWNVDREIVNLVGPLSLRWYSLFFLAGILLGHAIFLRMAEKEGKSTAPKDPLLYYVVVGTIVGARLAHCLFYDTAYTLQNPLHIFKIWEGGLASHGGFLGVFIALIFFTRKYKEYPFLWLVDRGSILALMAGGFIRLGNFFNSEIIGKVSTVPWAIVFAKVDNQPRHPTQLYEAAAYFLISFLVYRYYLYCNRKVLSGRLLGLICIFGFSARFIIELFKENQSAFENGLYFNMGQILSIPCILVGVLLAAGFQKRFLWASDR